MGFQEYPDNRITQWIYITVIIVYWENFDEKTLISNSDILDDISTLLIVEPIRRKIN